MSVQSPFPDADETLKRLRDVGMEPKDSPQHIGLKRASVLIPLFRRPSSGIHVLLTQRPKNMRTHAGEVCFPGGQQDPEDEQDDVVTALREAYEEVGLSPEHVRPICRLPTIESVNHLCVTPIVALVEPSSAAEPHQLKISQAEVDAAFSVPLSYFSQEANHESKYEVVWAGGVFIMRTFLYTSEFGKTFKVWGLTAHVAHQIAMLVLHPTLAPPSNATTNSEEFREEESLISLANSFYGYLYQKITDLSQPYWSRRFFVCERHVLHQYSNEGQALQAASCANKQKLMALPDSNVLIGREEELGGKVLYTFSIVSLNGRLRWDLAADNKDERSRWMAAIQERAHQK